MSITNSFELILDTRSEKLDGKIREVSQRIRIDNVELNPQYAVCLSSLVKSLYGEGEYYIFTCGCGSSGCVGIQEGVKVTHRSNLINWKVRNPISSSGYESFNHWLSNSKIIQYEFNKTNMMKVIFSAMDKLKNNVDENTVFAPNTFLLKDFLCLRSKMKL